MNSFRFSVIIPTYNRVEFLNEAIQSVLNQSFQDFELIIVDDASTDATQKLLNTFKENPKIKIYINSVNKGVSFSRNKGIQKSMGEIITFLDSDDIWLKRKLEKQNEYFTNNEVIKVCHTNEKWLKNNKHMNQKKIHRKQGGFFYERALERCLVSPSSIAIYKDVFDKISYFDETLPVCEDYDLWLKLNNSLQFGYLEEILIIKRAGHDNQLSMTYPTMDKYRVISLINILKQEFLTFENKELTLINIKSKLKILENGAIKHKNSELQKFCKDTNTFLKTI